MLKTLTALTACSVAVLISGCGGGGSGGGGGGESIQSVTLSLTGVAATGKSIPGATVNAKCKIGVGATTTLADGSYNLIISGGVLPCMLQVSDPTTGTKIHSFTTGSGSSAVANLTPLTDMVTARVFRRDPAINFAAFDAAGLAATLTEAKIELAHADVISVLSELIGVITVQNFISTPLVAATVVSPQSGNAYDKMLDALNVKITPTQVAQVVTGLANVTNTLSTKSLAAAMVSIPPTVNETVSALTVGDIFSYVDCSSRSSSASGGTVLFTCTEWRLNRTTVTSGEKWLRQSLVLSDLTWTPGSGDTEDVTVLTNGGWKTLGRRSSETFTYSAEGPDSALIQSDQLGYFMHNKFTVTDVSGKTVAQLLSMESGSGSTSRLSELSTRISKVGSEYFLKTALPKGSLLYFINKTIDSDIYTFESLKDTCQWQALTFTSLSELIAASACDKSSAGLEIALSASDSGLFATFDSGGTYSNGTVTIWRRDATTGFARTALAAKGRYEVRTVYGEQVLFVIPPPNIVNARTTPPTETIFAVSKGRVIRGEYLSAAYLNSILKPSMEFNEVAMRAILEGAGLPAFGQSSGGGGG